jgi:hypothetical protein
VDLNLCSLVNKWITLDQSTCSEAYVLFPDYICYDLIFLDFSGSWHVDIYVDRFKVLNIQILFYFFSN